VLSSSDAETEPAISLPDAAAASFGDTTLLEAIIGSDDRVKVSDQYLSTNPWRQICALRIFSSTGKMYVGTGWFIGPKALATAGHCVFLQDEGGWANWIDVIPAKRGAEEPFGKVRAKKFACVDGWTKQRSRDSDYGVIFLDDDTVGKQIGNFEVQALTDEELRGVDAKISGYPADRDRAEYQYYHERPLTSVTPARLNYVIDTFGGQSGSPIWQDTEEGGRIAVGIHTTGGLSSNSGTRISNDVLDNLISWLEATK
jgi:V8-like Glu-specific endopeptidase